MSYLKRIFISIYRRRGKSLLLFLIFLMCGVFIIGSLTICQATNEIQNNVRNELGATVAIVYNNELEDHRLYQYLFNPDTYAEERYQYDQNVQQVFEYMANNEKVSYANAEYYLFFDHVPLTSELNYSRQCSEEEFLHLLETGLQCYVHGMTSINFSYLESGKMLIVDGRNFTEEEMTSGKNVAIVSKDLYIIEEFCPILKVEEVSDTTNNYICKREDKAVQVGDVITLSSKIAQESGNVIERNVDFEIIGLYMDDDKLVNSDYGILVPNTSLENEYFYRLNELQMNPNTMNGSYFCSKWEMKLNDPYAAKTFTEEFQNRLNQAGLIERKAISSSDAYDAVASPLESLNSIGNILFILSIVATILIVALVNILFLKERKHEVGIYTSLGERKYRIIIQTVMEIFIIGMVAISLSLSIGIKFGDVIASTVLQQQVEKQQEIIEQRLEGIEGIVVEDISSQIVLEKYMISLTVQNILLIYLVSAGVILVSSLVPVYYVLRMNPKEIML